MPKKKKQNADPEAKAAALLPAIRRRRVAAGALKDGSIEDLRRKRISEGIAPWQILRYERIIDPEKTPIPLAPASYCRPKTFELHLQYLVSQCTVLPLAELVARLDHYQEIPERAVAVTLDGGHADAFLYALPLLLKYQVPATIFIPTAYIESGSFFYEDRMAMIMQILASAKLPLPKMDFLPDDFYAAIKEVAPKLEVNEQSARRFIGGLRPLPESIRIQVIAAFAQLLKDGPPPPPYEDFLRWDDMHQMAEKGVTFGLMGHSHVPAIKLSREEFLNDFLQSYQIAVKQQQLPIEKIYAFPMGVYSVETMDFLEQAGVRYAAVIDDMVEPRFQVRLPLLFGRVPMWEDVSFCSELFICRLWRLEISGIRF